MLNVALIGCGRIGRMHAELVAAHKKCRLSVAFDPVPVAADAICSETGASPVRDAQSIFEDESIGAVIVASATSTHAQYIENAVAAGKPVLCEKPIDLDFKRVLSCRDAIAGTDVPVQIGFNRRFDPSHRALREAVAAGEIGDLLQVIVSSRDPSPPPEDYLTVSGGIIRDMSIHDLDLARFILGEDEPVGVFARADALINPTIAETAGDADCAMILLHSRSGRQVLINNSRIAPYGYDQRVEAVGTLGMLQSANHNVNGLTRFTATGTAVGSIYQPFFAERYYDAFAGQLDSFVETVLQGRRPEADFEDGYAALRLAEAAYASLASGRLVNVEDV